MGPDSSNLIDTVPQNIAHWTRVNAEHIDARTSRAWLQDQVVWGIWKVPESQLGVLPDVKGFDVIELGCGNAYFAARLAKRGARPVGIDPTHAQLRSARRAQGETGLDFPLIEAVGECVPLADSSFDLALSEYGASLWAVPERWIAEAARLLRPRGRLVFLSNSMLSFLCSPDIGQVDERLHRSQFEMYRTEWADTQEVNYHLAHGDWIRLLRQHGFEVEDLIEIRAPETASQHTYYDFVSPAWARQWASEEIWKARKR